MNYIAAGKQPETCIPESSSQSSSHVEPTTEIIYRSLEKISALKKFRTRSGVRKLNSRNIFYNN